MVNEASTEGVCPLGGLGACVPENFKIYMLRNGIFSVIQPVFLPEEEPKVHVRLHLIAFVFGLVSVAHNKSS